MHRSHSRRRSRRGAHARVTSADLQLFPNTSRADVLETIFSEGFQYSSPRGCPMSLMGTTSAAVIPSSPVSYLRDDGSLRAHTSCVNALTFSNEGGQFLASGGDDLRILLWDFYQEDVREPIGSFVGPTSNILNLRFSASNRYLFSGGIDSKIFQYDVSYLGSSHAQVSRRSPDATSTWHDDTIRDISCHPMQDELYLSGSEDGKIIRHDEREERSSRAQNTLQLRSEVTGVQYHPNMEHLFLTSEQNGAVRLRDARMAFGPLSQRSQDGVVQVYNTKLMRSSRLSVPETSSITFDRDGSRFAVTMLHWYPTVYSVSDPNAIAICTGNNLPDGTPVPVGERSYSNSCTMKHGSFGGPGLETDEFYAAGSDDFRGYIWRLPPTSELLSQRQEFSSSDWQKPECANFTGFTSGTRDNKYLPVELSTPLCRLTGHDSIVNTVAFHPHFLHVATSGVERRIVLHSPTPSSPCAQDLPRSPAGVRALGTDGASDRLNYYQALFGEFTTVGESDLADIVLSESRTISMFDHILREEGYEDIFTLRKWTNSDDSSSAESGASDSDDEIEI